MKVILWMAMSVNGIIADEDGNEDFLSDEVWLDFVKAVRQGGCLIWSRKTYEGVKRWDQSYINSLEGVTKIVLSKQSNYQVDKDCRLANSPHDAVEIASKLGFRELILTGGPINNTSFAKVGLIDEVIVNLELVILGKGIRLFEAGDFQMKLKYVDQKFYGNSIIQLHYQVIKDSQ